MGGPAPVLISAVPGEWPPPFVTFRKIPRLNREVIITEKIDGTNGVIAVPEDPKLPLAFGSRNRWVTPGKGTDNYDFARWGYDNAEALRRLGPGLHHGEWWGVGIARKYNITERRFSLFNTTAWDETKVRELGLPANVHVVPVLARGVMADLNWAIRMAELGVTGSVAAPGYMQPEGIVLFHVAAGTFFKCTFGGDAVVEAKTPSPIENP